jgi:uncharacterized membrane protein YhaH (DUF805 family)
MGFWETVRTCFAKYVDFTGRASRPEFWYFELFIVLLQLIARMIDAGVFHASIDQAVVTPLQGIVNVATILPVLGVGTRRLHDTGRSGWWLLLALVPVIGVIVLINWFCQRGADGPNDHGRDPAAHLAPTVGGMRL